MALIRFQARDPAWSQAMNAEATRLWARFFSSGNTSNLHVSISSEWANFFTVLLLSPGNFTWTKQLLSTKFIHILNSSGNGTINFSLPTVCPENDTVCLAASEEVGLDLGGKLTKEEVSPSSRKRSLKRSSAIVETEVRRSTRIRDSVKGFKSTACSNKKCLACVTKPPTLKKETIKKIASDFCDMDESELNDDLLQQKRSKAHPVARARIVLGAPSSPQANARQPRNEEGEESQASGGEA